MTTASDDPKIRRRFWKKVSFSDDCWVWTGSQSGGGATHPANRVWLCRKDHEYCHSHPQEAHALGLRRFSWEGQ